MMFSAGWGFAGKEGHLKSWWPGHPDLSNRQIQGCLQTARASARNRGHSPVGLFP